MSSKVKKRTSGITPQRKHVNTMGCKTCGSSKLKKVKSRGVKIYRRKDFTS